jgi:hypothetical protein
MSSRTTLARTLAGALAIGALAAPAALARPAAPDWPAAKVEPARVVQNLRSPDAQDAAAQVAQREGAAAAQGRYYASYRDTTPLQQPDQSVAGDGTPWMAIAAGFAALLILVGSVTFAGRAFMRTRRTGATV